MIVHCTQNQRFYNIRFPKGFQPVRGFLFLSMNNENFNIYLWIKKIIIILTKNEENP